MTEIVEKWIDINYDHVPKYCTKCKIQGHNEHDCYVLHLELHPKRKEEVSKGEGEGKEMTNIGKVAETTRWGTEPDKEKVNYNGTTKGWQ